MLPGLYEKILRISYYSPEKLNDVEDVIKKIVPGEKVDSESIKEFSELINVFREALK